MANISNIETPDGSEYNLKDAISRRHLSYYGICTTAAATAAKVVTVDEDSFELQPGVIIGVHFSASNTADDVTLNVNNTGAKEIYYNNAVYDGHNTGVTGYAKRTIFYMYDGTHWVFLSQAVVDSNTDTKVRQTLSSGDANRPLLMAYSANTVTTTNVDNVTYRNNSIYANPSIGELHVPYIYAQQEVWEETWNTDKEKRTYIWAARANDKKQVRIIYQVLKNVSIKLDTAWGNSYYHSVRFEVSIPECEECYGANITVDAGGKFVAATIANIDTTTNYLIKFWLWGPKQENTAFNCNIHISAMVRYAEPYSPS